MYVSGFPESGQRRGVSLLRAHGPGRRIIGQLQGPREPRSRQPGKRVIATGAAIVALIAGAGTYVLTHGGGTPANAPISPGVTLRPPVPLSER